MTRVTPVDPRIVAYVDAALAEAPPLLTREDVARLCQVSTRTVTEWISTGGLVSIRHGGKRAAVRIPREALRDYLLARCSR